MDQPSNADNPQSVTPDPAKAAPPAADPGPPPALSPAQWLAQNSIPLMLMLALVVYLYKTWGFDGLMRGALVAVGLGFVVFIHELGHFVAAKMCDVHVSAFSLGFGPALPGCSFTSGETTYKIAILPLGGYVAMVGEGPEADEDEDYPRSFKNKSVLQRMFIISAGVVMNVLFGMVCFVLLYRFHGVDRPTAVVWRTEPGSRAWEEGVRPGWKITRIDSIENPFFDDLKYAVALSSSGSRLAFEFKDHAGKLHERDLMPFRDENKEMPAIGVAPSSQLRLFPARLGKARLASYTLSSASAHARVLPLERGDVPLATLADGWFTRLADPLPSGPAAWAALARRLRAAEGGLTVEVRRASGKQEAVQATVPGFDFGDILVGTTDPATPDDPFNVKPLPPDPNGNPKMPLGDPFEYRRRLALLAGKPMVFTVRRAAGEEESDRTVRVFVPPEFHLDFGMRMKMGKVAGIRKDSSAAAAKLAKGDVISAAGVRRDGKTEWISPKKFDPVRLPYELRRLVHEGDVGTARVVLKVRRPGDHKDNELELPPMAWDDTWTVGDEGPMGVASPMSIPQLGIAYRVESTIAEVTTGSPADLAGLQVGDQIVQLRFKIAGPLPGKTGWSKWVPLASIRGKEKEVYDQWAHYFYSLQRGDFHEAEFRVNRVNEMVAEDVPTSWLWRLVWGQAQSPRTFGPVTAMPDETWPLAERGLLLMSDVRRHKASTLVEAAGLGVDRSLSFIRQIYMNLRSLLTGRIAASSLGGPLEIASQAFSFAAEDWFVFAGFLGIISINLAVVNFLPIPVLDGGHMVFLLYELVRGKRPSESVQTVATVIGLMLLLALMVFVFYRDILRNF